MVSMKIHDKALRLIERGDVTLIFVQEHRVQATVASFDSFDEYAVRLYRDRWRCDCEARKQCCHIHAVALVTEPPPQSQVLVADLSYTRTKRSRDEDLTFSKGGHTHTPPSTPGTSPSPPDTLKDSA